MLKKFKISYIMALLLLTGVKAVYSQECTIKFDYSVVKEGDLYALSLTNALKSGTYELKLYDLNNGEIVEVKTLEFISGVEKLSFSNIVSGRYTVYIKENVCNTTRTLGGYTGIDLTSE